MRKSSYRETGFPKKAVGATIGRPLPVGISQWPITFIRADCGTSADTGLQNPTVYREAQEPPLQGRSGRRKKPRDLLTPLLLCVGRGLGPAVAATVANSPKANANPIQSRTAGASPRPTRVFALRYGIRGDAGPSTAHLRCSAQDDSVKTSHPHSSVILSNPERNCPFNIPLPSFSGNQKEIPAQKSARGYFMHCRILRSKSPTGRFR